MAGRYMTLDRKRALELRDEKVPFRERCAMLGVTQSNLQRFYNSYDLNQFRGPSMPFRQKEVEPEGDYELYHRKQEAKEAEIIWAQRMGIESWSGRKK